MRYVNINGRIFNSTSAGVPYDSRVVRYGFGLFETMLVIDGQIQLKEMHWERLFSGIEQLELIRPELMTKEWMEEELLRTVKKNQLEKLCRVRFQVYAGRGGLFEGQNTWTEFLIDCQPVEPSLLQLNDRGLYLIYSEGLRKSPNAISNLKCSNFMLYALAARQAVSRKADNAIMVNTHGNAMETTLSNIFCIKGDTIYTPPLSEGCIAGVMRRYIMDQLGGKGFTIKEEPFTPGFLESADSVFVTNAVRRIKWVQRIEDKRYEVGKVLDVYENVSY